MMEYVGLGEVAWMILPIYAMMLLALLVPLVLFLMFLWKIHNFANLTDAGIIYEHQKASKRFINNINDMMEAWIEERKEKK